MSRKIILIILALGCIVFYNNCGNVLFDGHHYETAIGNPKSPQFAQAQTSRVIDNSANVSTPNFGNSVSNGDLLLCVVFYNSAIQTVATITDNMGNGYNRATGPSLGAGQLVGWTLETWLAANAKGGPGLSVRANFTGTFSGEKNIICNEYSNVSSVNPLDTVTSGPGNTANATINPTLTSYADDLIFGAGAFAQMGATNGPTFTQRSNLPNLVTEDKTVNSIGSYTVTFSNPAMDWLVHFLAIKGN